MNLKEIYKEKLETNEQIVNASLSKNDELIFMDSKAEVFRYSFKTKKQSYLFDPKTNTNFDPKEQSTIYTLDEIVVVVNDYKTSGSVHYPNKFKFLTLNREDYYANISKFPISLFNDKEDIPHLIYSQAWNHIQIVNLNTRQILTASKSIIKEGAEEKHIEYRKKYQDSNKLMWPNPYDYFFGELKLSPNKKYFLSAGWCWGSCDSYNAYNIEEFIKSNRISDIPVTAGEHETRATSWVDNETIAVCCHQLTEGEDTQKDLYKIDLYKMSNQEFTFIESIDIYNIDIVNTKMYYDTSYEAFIFVKRKGLFVISKKGKMLYSNENINIKEYKENYFLTVNDNLVSVLKLIN